jgi:hypothetical protein
MGREVVVAITDGQFGFEPWEQIFYAEFDGRGRTCVLVKVNHETLVKRCYWYNRLHSGKGLASQRWPN